MFGMVVDQADQVLPPLVETRIWSSQPAGPPDPKAVTFAVKADPTQTDASVGFLDMAGATGTSYTSQSNAPLVAGSQLVLPQPSPEDVLRVWK